MDQSTLLQVVTQTINVVMLAARHMVEVWDAEDAMRRKKKFWVHPMFLCMASMTASWLSC
jgi:hypothetical protein